MKRKKVEKKLFSFSCLDWRKDPKKKHFQHFFSLFENAKIDKLKILK